MASPLNVADSKENRADASEDEAPEHPSSVTFLSLIIVLFFSFFSIDYDLGYRLVVFVKHTLGLLHFLIREGWIDIAVGLWMGSWVIVWATKLLGPYFTSWTPIQLRVGSEADGNDQAENKQLAHLTLLGDYYTTLDTASFKYWLCELRKQKLVVGAVGLCNR